MICYSYLEAFQRLVCCRLDSWGKCFVHYRLLLNPFLLGLGI